MVLYNTNVLRAATEKKALKCIANVLFLFVCHTLLLSDKVFKVNTVKKDRNEEIGKLWKLVEVNKPI